MTLSAVLDRLSPYLGQIAVLHRVFCTGVAEVPAQTPNVVRASHLLNTLYKAIIEYDSVGEASEQTVSVKLDRTRPDHNTAWSHSFGSCSDADGFLTSLCLFQVALLFSLWTETVRPYLEIVDEWIVHGHLFDPAKEFIIQR